MCGMGLCVYLEQEKILWVKQRFTN